MQEIDLNATPLLRMLLARVQDALGDEASARTWLTTPCPALGDAIPAIHAEQSLPGLAQVVNVLGHIETGDTFV